MHARRQFATPAEARIGTACALDDNAHDARTVVIGARFYQARRSSLASPDSVGNRRQALSHFPDRLNALCALTMHFARDPTVACNVNRCLAWTSAPTFRQPSIHEFNAG